MHSTKTNYLSLKLLSYDLEKPGSRDILAKIKQLPASLLLVKKGQE
jgi:hypothetical protein